MNLTVFWLQAHKGVNVESMLAKCLVGTLAPPSPATQRRNSQSIAKSKPELIVKSVMQTFEFYLSSPSPLLSLGHFSLGSRAAILGTLTVSTTERGYTQRTGMHILPLLWSRTVYPNLLRITLQTASLTQTINGEATWASNEQPIYIPQCLYCVTNSNAIFGCQHF